MTKQISLRLPDDLHEQTKAAAEDDHRSLHAEIIHWIEEGLERRKGDQS